MNFRKHGEAPYKVAVIHGGPGAAGEMAPVAKVLSAERGILEPLQTAVTIRGQIEELRAVLEQEAARPAVLIGFSWGAWLALLTVAAYPKLAKKLILIGCGPLEAKYAAGIMTTRRARLTGDERRELDDILKVMEKPTAGSAAIGERLGDLMARADAYDAIEEENEEADFSQEIFRSVWPQAARLRQTGELLRQCAKIVCPVVAIHGDYDPHPAEGVSEPLKSLLKDFRFILIEKCGHKPWIERLARESFFLALRKELEGITP